MAQTQTSTPNTSNAVAQFQLHAQDTGSASVQIARLTHRINGLSGHFKGHKKDFHSREGLIKMVSRRRRLLEYLKRSDQSAYRKLIDELGLRK